MAFAVAFLIAVLIGLIITDAVTSTSWEEIERCEREEEKDVIGNVWIPSQKGISEKSMEDEDE